MKATDFNFQGAMFTFGEINGSLLLEVMLIPTGGAGYGYIVHLDGEEIARGVHSGRFSSGDAAEVALQAFAGRIQTVQEDFGGMRVINGDAVKRPPIGGKGRGV